MADTEKSKKFLDTMAARAVAILLAVALGTVLWTNYAQDFKRLMAGQSATGEVAVVSATESAKPANPALQACLSQRIGDVDQMKSEGILSDAQYSAFKMRAEELCRAQNPAS